MSPYNLLKRMTFSKTVTQTVIKAVKARLENMLENKEAQYKHWQEHIKHKLNPTRKKEVERAFKKVIQAYKIIIFDLTPYFERTADPPVFVNKKKEP